MRNHTNWHARTLKNIKEHVTIEGNGQAKSKNNKKRKKFHAEAHKEAHWTRDGTEKGCSRGIFWSKEEGLLSSKEKESNQSEKKIAIILLLGARNIVINWKRCLGANPDLMRCGMPCDKQFLCHWSYGRGCIPLPAIGVVAAAVVGAVILPVRNRLARLFPKKWYTCLTRARPRSTGSMMLICWDLGTLEWSRFPPSDVLSLQLVWLYLL